MNEDSQEGIISLVNSIFDVNEFTKTEFTLEFKIANLEFQTKFEDLARSLENKSYACRLLKKNDQVYIEIQKFTVKKPRTGESIQIAASQKVKFLPAKSLKEMFNR